MSRFFPNSGILWIHKNTPCRIYFYHSFFPSVNSRFILSALCFQVGLDETSNTNNLEVELHKLLLFGTDTSAKCRGLGLQSEVMWMTKNKWSEARKWAQWYHNRYASAQRTGHHYFYIHNHSCCCFHLLPVPWYPHASSPPFPSLLPGSLAFFAFNASATECSQGP